MARALTDAFISQLVSDVCRPAFFFEGFFGTTALRLWTGRTDKTFNLNTYYGNGWLHGFSPVTETENLSGGGLVVLLSGVPTELISTILGNSKKYGKGILSFAFLDNLDQVVAVDQSFIGRFQKASIVKGTNNRIQLDYSNVTSSLERPKELRWNNETQQSLYPGDRGFEYVKDASEWSGYWGIPESKKESSLRGGR